MMVTADRVREAALLLFAAIAIVAGGSSIAPGGAMLVQLAALVALGASLAMPTGARVAPAAWAGMVLLAGAVAIGLLQLVPLPATVWAALPGRETAGLVFSLVSPAGAAHALSLDPEATRRSLLALLPVAAGFICVVRADYVVRYRLALLLVALALVDLLLGAMQFASRGAFGIVHATPHAQAAVGFFANRNHNADLLLIAPLIAAAVISWDPVGRFQAIAAPLSFGLLAIFMVGVLTASSRAGLLLLAIAVPVAALLSIHRLSPRRLGLVFAMVGALALALLLAARFNPVAANVFARFGSTQEGRFDFWPDVVFAVRSFLAWGSGLGTFDGVYRSVEALGTVTPYYVNHAHNEYLEVALEAGVPGIVLMALGLALYAWLGIGAVIRALRGRGDPLALAAVAGIAILLLHSLVDYPLRAPALAALFGMLWGLCHDPVPADRATRAD